MFTFARWVVLSLLMAAPALAAPRALPEGQLPNDKRLESPKDLNGYFPFTPPATREAWEVRAAEVRRQVLVACGLWPMPKPTPLNAVVHGKLELDDYTVERVYFESYPGFFVTGSLYKPKQIKGRVPAVLCPHGHWPNGRFYDNGETATKRQITEGAERFEDGGRSPLQSRCMQLARMGCIVFHYDMIGYADSQQISFNVAHRYGKPRSEMEGADNWGLFSAQAELRLQSIFGLQTYNSIRALDWLLTLSEVDPTRIGVTGASGGGTQTFILGAVDPRVTVQFPAVMVSTAMQGGCTCENCSLLRINTGNIELAGLFAPKPLGMAAANDWTKEIMTKGLPELQQLYKLLGAPDNVMAKPLVHFPHNYNYVSRSAMYHWFNKHLALKQSEPIVEGDYRRLSNEEMTVWDDKHPAPPSGDDYERSLCRQIDQLSEQQRSELKHNPAEQRRVVGGGWEAIIGRSLPTAGSIEYHKVSQKEHPDYLEFAALLRNKAQAEEIPVVFLHPAETWNNQVVVWVSPQGKAGLYSSSGEPKAEVLQLLRKGYAVTGVDLFGQGEFLAAGQSEFKNRKVKTERQFAGFTYGYNHPLFAQRVHDLLSVVSYVKGHKEKPQQVHLVALEGAGKWAAAAALVAGQAVDRSLLDLGGFRFQKLTAFDDADFLPGAVKYGDLPGLVGLLDPQRVHDVTGQSAATALQALLK